ncbi:MAG: metal-dependent phosphohydrolase, partial [Desulfobacteraceae bacterium 4572_88]
GPKNYDASTGYKSKSMLVTPLKNHKNEIIGVLQLLNAQTETGEVIPFSAEYENLVASLASQAAVALTNNRLIWELKEALQTIKALFDAFIKSIATAIEEKSSYTGGHIERVAKLTMMIAKAINESSEGPLKDVCLSEDELEELRLAAWMHDIGKITTPQYIMDKATKLETIFDRIHMLETRFQLIVSLTENAYLHRKLGLLQGGNGDESELSQLDAACAREVQGIGEEFEFVRSCNKGFMDGDKIAHLREIANKTYILDGQAHPYLTEEEFTNLSVRKGTLTDEERKTIENHVVMTWDILYPLPFPHALANVPDYAREHHEKLDGSGYPRGLSGKEIPLQSRILAIADIFEALTARDRPYRDPMKLSKAIDILKFMKQDNHIDPNIYDLFVSSSILSKYAREEMNPEQIDAE